MFMCLCVDSNLLSLNQLFMLALVAANIYGFVFFLIMCFNNVV